MASTPFQFDPQRFAAWCVLFGVVVAFLVLGRPLLVPLAIAIFVWILLGSIKSLLRRVLPARHAPPEWFANLIAIASLVLITYGVFLVLASQAEALVAAVPVYEANLNRIVVGVLAVLKFDELPRTEVLLEQIDIGAVLSWIGDSVTALMSDTMLIAIYVGFLLAEEKIIPEKVRHLYQDPEKASRVAALVQSVGTSIERYIGMKTVVSIWTGLVSYLILALVGVDFAAVWGLLVFFFNFIPTIGSIIAAILPTLLTLLQFESLTPFLIVGAGLGLTQFVIGNVVEPAYMGRSLNLSSLMILLSLTFWGIVWGLPGMFLAVPLMVMTGIVCAEFDGLRWISVLLSADGRLIGTEGTNEEAASGDAQGDREDP